MGNFNSLEATPKQAEERNVIQGAVAGALGGYVAGGPVLVTALAAGAAQALPLIGNNGLYTSIVDIAVIAAAAKIAGGADTQVALLSAVAAEVALMAYFAYQLRTQY